MEKSKARKVSVIITLVIIIAIVASIIVGVLLKDNNSVNKSLNYDYGLGKTAFEKVENAQYTPDIDKYNAINATQSAELASVMGVSSKTTDKFAALIDEYAKVDNYAGAGKYLGYDIYEIKDEIKFIVETVPAFNQWFRMPSMREEQGFASIPYYESWAYYLEMDKDTGMLSVTRVCWATRSDYLDFENKKTVEDYADGSSFIQFEVMKTNYLETDTDEIVECFIYSVGIDRVKQNGNNFNENTQDYHPFEFQYLRNVRDKSMVKYHITTAKRYSDSQSFDQGGMDIRGLTPYGVRREFTIVNYDGYTDIDVTKIDQKFATLDNPLNNGSVDFDVNSNNISILLEAIGFKGYVANLSPKELLDVVAKHIINNFEIKNNWATIYKDQRDAIKIDGIKGPFYEKEMWLNNVTSLVSCCGQTQRTMELSAYAQIRDMSKFDNEKEYSLSMALKSRENGKYYIIASEYKKIADENYPSDNYFVNIDVVIDSSTISVDESGTYDVVCVLTVKEGGEDVVLFDTLETAFVRTYHGLIIPNSADKYGNIYKYDVKGSGGKIVITVSGINN